MARWMNRNSAEVANVLPFKEKVRRTSHIVLFKAMKVIQEGEELTYCYDEKHTCLNPHDHVQDPVKGATTGRQANQTADYLPKGTTHFPGDAQLPPKPQGVC